MRLTITPGEATKFQQSPAAASPLNRSDYATLLVLCRHPDGVEDAVRITLEKVNGTWKVCGGPAAATAPTPF